MSRDRMEPQCDRIWSAAESARDCIAAFLIDNELHDAYAYIAETRSACPKPHVFTFVAIAGASYASVKIRASQIDHNKDDIALFSLLVGHCLYQRLKSY